MNNSDTQEGLNGDLRNGSSLGDLGISDLGSEIGTEGSPLK
jgi:hypothetical protein